MVSAAHHKKRAVLWLLCGIEYFQSKEAGALFCWLLSDPNTHIDGLSSCVGGGGGAFPRRLFLTDFRLGALADAGDIGAVSPEDQQGQHNSQGDHVALAQQHHPHG